MRLHVSILDEPLEEQSSRGNEQQTATTDAAAHAGAVACEEAEGPHLNGTAAPPSPRIVEGTVVESILLSRAAEEDPETEEATSEARPLASQPPRRTRLLRVGLLLTVWIIPIVLVGTLLLAQLVPGLAGPLSRVVPGLLLFVSAEGVWSYPVSETRLHQLASLIAGKCVQNARTLLLHMQGT